MNGSSTIAPSGFFTDFMLEYITPQGERGNLQKFIAEQPNYDIAFCAAWRNFTLYKDQPVKTTESFLDLLDKIHQATLAHLPPIRKVNEKGDYIKIHGKADGKNWYDIGFNWNVDDQGAIDLINKIWNSSNIKYSLEIVIKEGKITLNKNGLHYDLANNNEIETLERDPTNEPNVLQFIRTAILNVKNLPPMPDHRARMLLKIDADQKTREKQVKIIGDHYFERIALAKTDDEKLETIVLTLRELLQLHMYYDGNGRSTFIFSNLLFHQNGLPLCYPKNRSIFDAYSIPRMVQEVKEGQKRFVDMFGTEKTLSEGLEEYYKDLFHIQDILNSYATDDSLLLKRILIARDLNLLLRQSAVDGAFQDLLGFLLKHANHLNINIHAQGKNSGNALDIALKKKNTNAVNLLKSKGLKPSRA